MLSNLEQYMFSNDNLIKYTRYRKKIINTPREIKEYKKNEIKNTTVITPQKEDKLFWCFYIALYGYEKYMLESSTHFKIEKEFKISAISKIREKKAQLKPLKLKISDIEDDLVNKKCITLKTFHALSLCYNLSFVIVYNDLYYDFNYNNKESYFIIEHTEQTGYSLCLNTDKLNEIKNNNYLVDSSIKSIGSYTLGELQTIAVKLKISIKQDTGKNKIKKELYENIIQKLN